MKRKHRKFSIPKFRLPKGPMIHQLAAVFLGFGGLVVAQNADIQSIATAGCSAYTGSSQSSCISYLTFQIQTAINYECGNRTEAFVSCLSDPNGGLLAGCPLQPSVGGINQMVLNCLGLDTITPHLLQACLGPPDQVSTVCESNVYNAYRNRCGQQERSTPTQYAQCALYELGRCGVDRGDGCWYKDCFFSGGIADCPIPYHTLDISQPSASLVLDVPLFKGSRSSTAASGMRTPFLQGPRESMPQNGTGNLRPTGTPRGQPSRGNSAVNLNPTGVVKHQSLQEAQPDIPYFTLELKLDGESYYVDGSGKIQSDLPDAAILHFQNGMMYNVNGGCVSAELNDIPSSVLVSETKNNSACSTTFSFGKIYQNDGNSSLGKPKRDPDLDSSTSGTVSYILQLENDAFTDPNGRTVFCVRGGYVYVVLAGQQMPSCAVINLNVVKVEYVVPIIAPRPTSTIAPPGLLLLGSEAKGKNGNRPVSYYDPVPTKPPAAKQCPAGQKLYLTSTILLL